MYVCLLMRKKKKEILFLFTFNTLSSANDFIECLITFLGACVSQSQSCLDIVKHYTINLLNGYLLFIGSGVDVAVGVVEVTFVIVRIKLRLDLPRFLRLLLHLLYHRHHRRGRGGRRRGGGLGGA